MNTKEELVENIKRWVSYDHEIKNLQKSMKEIRDKKKELTKKLIDVMKNKHTCCWIFKSGKNKGSLCNANSYILEGKNYCYTHHNKINKTKEKGLSNEIEDTWDTKYDEFIKKYKVDQLKKILRENKLIIGGNKKELIIRIIKNNITL